MWVGGVPGLKPRKGLLRLYLGKEGTVESTWAADLQAAPDHNLSPAKLAIQSNHATNVYGVSFYETEVPRC